LNALLPFVSVTLCMLLSGCGPHYLAANDIHQAPYLDESSASSHLMTRDATSLAWESWHPAQATPQRAMLLGLHSYGDFRLAYADLGPWLAGQGIVTYAYDQRGFGESSQQGRWPESPLLVEDLVDAITVLRQRHPNLPLIVAGESMGGSVILNALAQHPALSIDGSLLAAPGVRGGIRWRYLYNAGLWTAAHLIPATSVEVPRRYPEGELKPAAARRLAEDSRVVHSVRLDAYYGLIRFTDHASDDIAALFADTRLPPTLLLHGDRDETVPRVAIERLVSDWPSASRDTLEIHYLPEAPHLLLQWHDSEPVRGRIAHWLAEILPSRASQE